MWGWLLRRVKPDYGRRAEQITPITMLKGMIGWFFGLLFIGVLVVGSSLLTRNAVIPFLLGMPGIGVWAGAVKGWTASIVQKIAGLQAEDRWVEFKIHMLGRRVGTYTTYWENLTPLTKIEKDRKIQLEYHDKMKFIGIEPPANGGKLVEIPIETYNYAADFHFYLDEPGLFLADRAILMLKDKYEDLEISKPTIVGLGGWFGPATPRFINADLELVDLLDGVNEQLILRQRESVRNIEEHLDRVQIQSDDWKQLLAAVVGDERKGRITAEYSSTQKSYQIAGSAKVQQASMRDTFRLAARSGEALGTVLGGPKQRSKLVVILLALLAIMAIGALVYILFIAPAQVPPPPTTITLRPPPTPPLGTTTTTVPGK